MAEGGRWKVSHKIWREVGIKIVGRCEVGLVGGGLLPHTLMRIGCEH